MGQLQAIAELVVQELEMLILQLPEAHWLMLPFFQGLVMLF